MVENTPEGNASPTPGLGDHLRWRWRELYEQGRADRRECGRLRAELEFAAARYDMLLANLKRHRRALAAVQALVGEMLAREQVGVGVGDGDGRLEGGIHHADALLGGLRPRRDPALPVAFPEQYDRLPFMVPEELPSRDYEREFGPAFVTFLKQEREGTPASPSQVKSEDTGPGVETGKSEPVA